MKKLKLNIGNVDPDYEDKVIPEDSYIEPVHKSVEDFITLLATDIGDDTIVLLDDDNEMFYFVGGAIEIDEGYHISCEAEDHLNTWHMNGDVRIILIQQCEDQP